MPIARNPRLKLLKEFALEVGAKIKVEYPRIGEIVLVLVDKDGEPVAREHDTFDMLDTIQAYYGGHPRYAEARQQFDYMAQ